MLQKAPKARICCWGIEIIVTLGIIGTIIALIFQIIVRLEYLINRMVIWNPYYWQAQPCFLL